MEKELAERNKSKDEELQTARDERDYAQKELNIIKAESQQKM